MNVQKITGEDVDIRLSFLELYTIIQCMAEADRCLDDTEVETIVGSKRTFVSEICSGLNNLKEKMMELARSA